MTIEIKENGSKEFYKEVVNINSQIDQFLVEPQAALKDSYKANRNQALLMPVLFIMMLLIGLRSGFRAWVWFCLVTSGMASVTMLILMKKTRDQINAGAADKRKRFLTLDESGVRFDEEGSQPVSIEWDSVAMIRKFDESVCFFPKDRSVRFIAVPAGCRQEIANYLEEANIGKKIM